MIEIILALIILTIILFLFFKLNKKNKRVEIKPAVSNEENDREAFNKSYARQFRALGRNRKKNPEEFKKLYSKMAKEKKDKGFD